MINTIKPGDRVNVVLDVITEPDAYRVVLVGVFDPYLSDQEIPDPEPGATRNIVQSWFDRVHHARAFKLSIEQP